jgi:hypothetical protein
MKMSSMERSFHLLTMVDRTLLYGMFSKVDDLIAEIGENHIEGDYVGAALAAVERLQLFLEGRRKELECDSE